MCTKLSSEYCGPIQAQGKHQHECSLSAECYSCTFIGRASSSEVFCGFARYNISGYATKYGIIEELKLSTEGLLTVLGLHGIPYIKDASKLTSSSCAHVCAVLNECKGFRYVQNHSTY